MEKERTISPAQALSIYPAMPYAAPMHTNTIPQSQPQNIPVYCEANQPGWEQLNKIMNTSYHSNQPACANEVELKPIYRPMSTTTTQKETKPLLQTNPSQPDKTVMEKLYNKAHYITSFHFDNQKDQYEKLITFIQDMHNAKNNGIHEDLMTTHAYKNGDMKVTMFFSYLKRYNQRKEPLPHINDLISTKKVPQIKNQLAHLFDIPSPYNTTTTTQQISDFDVAVKHPALNLLNLNLLKINTISSHSYTGISALFSYIYSTAKNTQNDYVGLSYDNLKDKFYELAYYVVQYRHYTSEARQRNQDRIYNLLQIIEAGTTLNPQKQEDDFGYDMITKELTISEIFGTFISPTNIPHIKKYIGLLCSLIKKYNKKRETKCTPTKEQMLAYEAYERLDITLPDSFNTTLLNGNYYAFKELTELSKNVSYLSQLELFNLDQNLVDECVQYLYKNAI
jgi:hypothetical protein